MTAIGFLLVFLVWIADGVYDVGLARHRFRRAAGAVLLTGLLLIAAGLFLLLWKYAP